ncbi:hypothetical protein F8388_015452 [Cannabis sativa]|uniref:Uncharacterized protein n=1 Tax=Cannabis sativa TaxID=3483 RepID=A0A7J6GI62_CANSA|nr:hypothetical protein F8388_015452 [Cannabis sativa]
MLLLFYHRLLHLPPKAVFHSLAYDDNINYLSGFQYNGLGAITICGYPDRCSFNAIRSWKHLVQPLHHIIVFIELHVAPRAYLITLLTAKAPMHVL